MGSGKRLNDTKNGQIKAFKDLNLSISDISRKVNRFRKVIRHYLNDSESYGTKTSPGRPQKLYGREKRVLREASKGFSSTRNLKNNLNLEVSRWTVFRIWMVQMAINIIGTMSEGPKKHLTEISEVAQ